MPARDTFRALCAFDWRSVENKNRYSDRGVATRMRRVGGVSCAGSRNGIDGGGGSGSGSSDGRSWIDVECVTIGGEI